MKITKEETAGYLNGIATGFLLGIAGFTIYATIAQCIWVFTLIYLINSKEKYLENELE